MNKKSCAIDIMNFSKSGEEIIEKFIKGELTVIDTVDSYGGVLVKDENGKEWIIRNNPFSKLGASAEKASDKKQENEQK